MSIITLTTDFGLADWFVGTMKGVILSLAPRARVVDITHSVPAGDIRAGAFALAAAGRYFPPGTVHVAVVDPGVGSDRAAIAVRTKNQVFIGPDNGVLSLALERESVKEVRRIENRDLFLASVSNTFHGRDIFAPVAARLSAGLPFNQVGGRIADFARLPPAVANRFPQGVKGTVVYLDGFGNAITNIPNDAEEQLPGGRIHLRGGKTIPVHKCYAAVPAGQAVAVPGASGFLEIAVNRGHAGKQLRLRVGTDVELRAKPRG